MKRFGMGVDDIQPLAPAPSPLGMKKGGKVKRGSKKRRDMPPSFGRKKKTRKGQEY